MFTSTNLSRYLSLLLTLIMGCYLAACTNSRPASELPEKPKESYVSNLSELDIRPLSTPESTPYSGAIHPDSILNEMTLEQKVGQLFFTYASGNFLNETSAEFQRLKDRIQRQHIGGLIFFRGDVYDQAILTNRLQQISKYPLWITQDMEYGAAMRVRNTTRFTPNMGIAATGNPEYAYWAGKITAMEAKALGVHQIFAPVLDVNNNPDNPVINVRSYGGDPDIVSQFGLKFIEGVSSTGLISTAKHFPGHGDTDSDSHIDLPVVRHDYARLDSVELAPFRAAIRAGLPSVMSAHIAFPEISKEPGLPSTLDNTILNHILTDSLNFEGVVITDGLEMQGIASNYSPGEAVVRSLKAGADLMLLSPDEITAIHEVIRAVQRGELSEERIENSVRKLLDWKIRQRLFEKRTVDLETLPQKINRKEYRLVADEIARSSITLLKNDDDILPIRVVDYPKIMVLALADDETGRTGTSLARRIRDYHPDVTFHIYDKRTSEADKRTMLRNARDADLLILGSFIYVQTGKEIQLSGSQSRFINKLTGLNKPTALIAFGNPYVVHDLPDVDVHMMAWSSSYQQVTAAVPALFGASEILGRMPIEIPGMYQIGDGIPIPKSTLRPEEPEVAEMNSDSLRQIDRIMEEAIRDSVFPGGVVAVARNGLLTYHEAFGYHDYEKVTPVKTSDVYDLASLTKILATTPAVMKLIDEGELDLNDRVSKYIPAFKSGKKAKIRIKNLLLHNSGLPPFRVYVDRLKQREAIVEAIREEPLITNPYQEYIYSDLGFILLQDIVEQLTDSRLDRYMRKNFYYPMGMASTHFNPSDLGSWMNRRIPPTEYDTLIRNKLIQGEVHDERAYYMDGVGGHAGLFGSAQDLAVFAQMLLNKGVYAGKRYLSESVINEFTSRQSNLNNRGYGFDRKSEGFSTAGRNTSLNTYGHLGFTGTSLWIDEENDLVVILLTNRTYPYRSYGKSINQIRAAVADAAVSAIKKNDEELAITE